MELKTLIIAAGFALALSSAAVRAADNPADLNDLQLAHVAYTADNIDIRYAHLALAISKNPAVREFANTMICKHRCNIRPVKRRRWAAAPE